jgi:hypothetical protein
MIQKILSIVTILIVVMGLSGCRVPTVPEDCEGTECEADYCELNPTDLTCQNDDQPNDDEVDLLETALTSQSEATSFTEVTTYYSKLDEEEVDIVLEVTYEQDGSNDQFLFQKNQTNEWGQFESYYLYDIEGSSFDYYESNDGTRFYGLQDIDMGEQENLKTELSLSDQYTVSNTTISTYDYVVYHTTFDTFESLQTVVEAYYNYSILRNVPLSLFVDRLTDLPVDIYIDKDKETISKITIDFLPVVNQYRTSVGASTYDAIDFSIAYSNYNDAEVDIPQEHQPLTYVPSSFVYHNVPITFDMYQIDYPIDQMAVHPTDSKLFLLDSENYLLHILDYETLEDTPVSYDYKPITMHIFEDKLYVGIQRQMTQGYDEPTSNNGMIVIYDLETMQEINRFETLYDPGDIAVTAYGQIVVAPATGGHTKMIVYNLNGMAVIDPVEMNIVDNLQIYANPVDNRIYTFAYWQGVYDVFELDEDGHYKDRYRPDDFMSLSSNTPVELFFSPDGYTAFNYRGFVLLAINDEELDGQLLYSLGTNINDMDFETNSFFVAGDYGVYEFENATLENEAYYATPLPAMISKVDENQLITINELGDGKYVLMTSNIDSTCTDTPSASSCNSYEINDITYHSPLLSEAKQAVVTLVEEQQDMGDATFDSIRELEPDHYLVTYAKETTEIIVYIHSDGTTIEDINIKEITQPGTITEEEVRSLMLDMISGTTCDSFVGEAYYLCQTDEVRPYELLDNYYLEINGDSFKYDAIKEGYYYLGVFYEGRFVESDGDLFIDTLRVIDRSFEEGMDSYAMNLMYEMFHAYSRHTYKEDICDGYFINQEQTDFCNQIFIDRFGMGFNWEILWDYEESGKNAVELEFSDVSWFRYYFYYDIIMDENYNLALDFELISFDDPSLELNEGAAVSIVDRFLQKYQEPSSTDYCADYLSSTNTFLQDMCGIEDTLTFKGASDRPFFDYELVESLGDNTFVIKGFDNNYPDYFETYTVSFIFEDNRWKIEDLSWESNFTYGLEDAEMFVNELFHEVATYNDYEYCARANGVSYTNVTDECRVELILERLAGTRYTLLSITKLDDAEFTIVYQKQSISTTELITSEIRFYRGEWGTVSYIETITDVIEQHLVDGTLQEQIEARYSEYLIDLFDSTLDSETLYDTYINAQYDRNEYIISRTNLLSNTSSISIHSIEMIVDYRYQIYYEISFDRTDNTGQTSTETVLVKLNTEDDIRLAPLTYDVTYHVDPEEVQTYIEDVSESMMTYYFAPFVCEDYISSSHPLGCNYVSEYSFFEEMLDRPDIILTGDNTFTIRYALDSGLVMREYELVMALEEGTIRLVDHTIVVGE